MNSHAPSEGRPPAISARYVLDTLILKHQFQAKSEKILQLLVENSYCQYFIRLGKFTQTMPFEESSFSRVHERLDETGDFAVG